MSNFRVTRDLSLTQQKAAREAVALILTVLYRCGYFMVFPKCSLEPTTDLVFLGVGCDTVQRRFYMLWDKLRKLQAILREVFGSRRISYSQLEKLAGKCTSMSVAVPPASLYTHHMYRQIAKFKSPGGRNNLSPIEVSQRSGLQFENKEMVRSEDPTERGAVVRCHPTCSDHHRSHGRLVPSMGRPDQRAVRRVFRFQSSCQLLGGMTQRTY